MHIDGNLTDAEIPSWAAAAFMAPLIN